MKLLALLLLVTGSASIKTVVKIVDQAPNATQLATSTTATTTTPQSPLSLAADPDVVTDREEEDRNIAAHAAEFGKGLEGVALLVSDVFGDASDQNKMKKWMVGIGSAMLIF